MSKKTIALVLCMVMTMTIGLGSTLAYLTDTDADVNVMTLGNVDIEQIEQERAGKGALQSFTQAKPLYPAVGDVAKYLDLNGEEILNANGSLEAYKFLANAEGNDLPNAQDKIVTVKNVGKGDAYVRTIIAFEVAADVNEVFPGGTHIGLMRNNGDNRNPSAGADTDGNTDWYWKWLNDVVAIDGNNYAIATVTHKAILEAGETTIPSLLQVYLKKNADNEYVSKLGETYDILVVSQAVQAAGFTDAETALNEAFGEITASSHPWMKEVDGGQDPYLDPVVIPTPVSTLEELNDAFANGGAIVFTDDIEVSDKFTIPANVTSIDLNGKKLTGNLLFEDNANVTISNGQIVNNNSAYSGLQTQAGVTLVLEDMEISSARHAVRVEGGNVTINGGKYTLIAASVKTLHAVNVSDGGSVVINDGTFVGPKGTTLDSGSAVNIQNGSTGVINGGNFSGGKKNTLSASGNLTVYGGTFDQNPSTFVAPGYKVNNNSGVYTVTK